MSEQSSTTSVYDSPVRLFAIIAASVFVSEALVMIILIILPPLPHVVAAPLDAALVTLLVFPILYRFVVRPMTQHISERRQAEAALRRIQDDLESRVQQRTAELAQANETLQVQIVERQHAGEELKVALDLVQRRQAEMAGLLTGARAVLEYRDFKEVAQAIFVACRSTIGAAAGYVALPNEDQSNETPVFLDLGEQASMPEAAPPIPVVGLRQQAYTSGKTVYTNDPTSCECTQGLPGRHMPLSSILFAPLTIKGFIVGTLGLANKPGGFSDDDAQLATAFAELAAIAVLNGQAIGLLESSERRFRTLAQATFEGIAISEGEFIREANEQFARMHGYSLPEVIGRSIADFLVPHEHERMRRVVTGDEMHVGEYQALRKDGSIFLLEVRAYSMEQSGCSMRVAALRDITEHKYAEQMLRENEEWLRLAFDAGDLGRWRYFVATDKIHLDARARLHSGANANDVSLTDALASIHPADRENLQQDMASALDPTGNGRYAAEYRVTWPDGEVHWLAVQARVYFAGDATTRQPVQAVGISQDITARKRMEEALRESRRDLDRAQEVGQIGSWRLDVRRNVLTWSAENHRIFGVPIGASMTYETFLETVHPDDREYVDRRWTAGLAGEPYDIEHRIIANGVVKWVREKAYLEFDQDGTLLGGFGITQDITERRQAEEALRRQVALIDLSPDAIIVRSLEGIITFWSQGAETLYGWKESEALGRQVSTLLRAQLPQPLERIAEQLKHTGRWSGEIIHFDKTGLQIVVQSWWLAQFNAQGDVTEIFESNVDFTVRKQMEEQLLRNQAELEQRVLERTAELASANNELRLQSAALQAAANGIIITDRQGNIQWANPALTEMTGYAFAEVLGQSTRLFRSDLKEPEFYQHLWNTILSGQVWRGELINRRKDGSLYVEEQTIAPVWNERGEIANFVAVKQDVTERKEAQARLEQNNRDLLALGNAERRARQIAETLSAANLALTRSLDLESVMEALLDYVYQLVPYDSANIMLLESEERLVVRAARGYEQWTDSLLTRAISFDAHSNRIFRELISTQKSILISKTGEYSDWDARPGAEHVRSWIGVPIVAGGHVIGVYSLDKATPGFFTNEHVRLAEALVGQAAVAIQNAWLFDQLRAGRERLQSLSRRLVEVQEAERHYVARELHDEAGQALTSLVYGLGELERETVPAQRALRLTELKKTTQEVLENLHHLAMDLRPASLDFLGLVPALNQYVKATGERYGLNVQFKVIGLTEERLPAAMETALYRIVQEALTNVIRHAQATRIDVLLERRDNQVVLVVEDNGSGFKADLAIQARTGHLGLVGMQERAEMLNGSLVIESAPDFGTTIVVEVPFAHSDSHRRRP